MAGEGLRIERDEIMAMIERLEGPEIRKASKNVLRKSARILAKETEVTFRESIKGLGTTKADWVRPSSKRTVYAWRKIARVEVGRKGFYAKVSILDKPGKKVGDFRAKFFEMGTKDRTVKSWRGRRLKKERKSGSIRESRPFLRAQNRTEARVFQSIDENLSKVIYKIANKKK